MLLLRLAHLLIWFERNHDWITAMILVPIGIFAGIGIAFELM